MAQGDKRPVVMEADLAVPGGPATLDENGILAESQRPSVDDLGAANNTLSNIPDPARALYNIGAKPGDNLLINADFRCPVNRNGGSWLIPPGTPYYSDTGLTAQVGTLTEYTTGIAMTGVYGGVIVDGVVYYVDWTVAARGYYLTSSKRYTVDRWYGYASSQENVVLVEAEGIRLHKGQEDTVLNIRQTLEGPDRLAGRTVTLSALVKGNTTAYLSANADGETVSTQQFPVLQGERYTLLSVTFTLPQTVETLYVVAGIPSDQPIGSVTIHAAKLELGDKQTLARQLDDGTWELIDPPNYALQYALCSLYSPTTGEWVGYQHSNPNLLDNWYFADPIDQRNGYVVPPDTPYYSDTALTTQAGTVSEYTTATYANGTYGTITVDSTTYYIDWTVAVRGYVDAGYGIDRWYSQYPTIVIIEDSSIKIVNHHGYPAIGFFIQRSEIYPIVGNSYTFSAIVKKSRADLQLRFSVVLGEQEINIRTADTTEYQFISASGICTSDTQPISCGFISDSGGMINDSISIIAAKLELGPVQTLAHQDADGNWVLNDPPPNKALELAKCQRYQRVVPFGTIGQIINASDIVLRIPFETPMRAAPTPVILENTFQFLSAVAYSGVFTGVNVVSVLASSEGIAYLHMSGFNFDLNALGLGPNGVFVLTQGKILLDANL